MIDGPSDGPEYIYVSFTLSYDEEKQTDFHIQRSCEAAKKWPMNTWFQVHSELLWTSSMMLFFLVYFFPSVLLPSCSIFYCEEIVWNFLDLPPRTCSLSPQPEAEPSTKPRWNVFMCLCVSVGVHLSHCLTGRSVWPETSWTTWGTMTSWCCACWKEATSSVPTWWTGSRLWAATPTARSPWGSTSSVSRATWWAAARCFTRTPFDWSGVRTERKSFTVNMIYHDGGVPWLSQKTCELCCVHYDRGIFV